jgi:3-oxoacyl-[acyl-carrier protein] reductase
MQLLKGKRAIITGATAGIGKGIARAFAAAGAHVVIVGTNEERAKEAVTELYSCKSSEDQVFTYKLINVSDKASVAEGMNALLADFGKCDILVNNAGITRDGLLMKMTEEDWDQVMDTNAKSAFHMSRNVIRGMLKDRSGKIINISSVVGLIGNAGQTNYAASKAAMIGFTKALALEVASRGICVNCIAPGFIQTKMTDVLTEAQKEAILKKIPMGRLGSCEDIANLAVFLASPLSDYITGQVLTVDGGMVM